MRTASSRGGAPRAGWRQAGTIDNLLLLLRSTVLCYVRGAAVKVTAASGSAGAQRQLQCPDPGRMRRGCRGARLWPGRGRRLLVAGRTAQCQNRRPRSRRRRSGTVPRRRAAKTRAGRWRAERSGVEGRVGQRGDEELGGELRAPLALGARERALVGRRPSVRRAVGSREMRKAAATRTAKDADDSISDNNSATRTTAAPAVEELSDAGEGGKGSES